MISSMTGYAVRTIDMEYGALNIELKSVNSRFLDPQFRIVEDLRALEPALRELLGAQLVRGKVDCRISFAALTKNVRSMVINKEALQQLKEFDAFVRNEFPQMAPITISNILSWPGIFGDGGIDGETLKTCCLGLFKETLDDFVGSRAREGEKLKAVILARVVMMRNEISKVTPYIDSAQIAHQEKLKQRLLEITGRDDNERIRQEVVLFSMSIDVAEEIARLSVHLDEVERILTTGGVCGKRLDFLMQELNREANTLGSKSVLPETTQTAMELKILIEQMREQIQNLE